MERFIWHKLYSSAVRKSSPEKAAKDLRQAVRLATALAEQAEYALPDSAAGLPKQMRKVVVSQRKVILSAVGDHAAVRRTLERATTVR